MTIPKAIVRRGALVMAAASFVTLFAEPTQALEKRTKLAVDNPNPSEDWGAGSSIRIHYYNICTGWVWVWSGFADQSRIGVIFSGSPSGGMSLSQAQIFCPTGAPSGYGFTGTLTARAADENNCPAGTTFASAPFLPTSLFTVIPFAGQNLPSRFALVATVSASGGIPNPASFGTDRPAAGPTGPQACGTCYPTTRQNRSFSWGTTTSPLCPGSPFNDGVCDAQLFWDVDVYICGCPVEPASWAKIKCLYR